MSFNTALSGLKVSQSDLGVISNNIANASTVGFKSSRSEFADIFAAAGGGVSKTAVGSGVTLARIAQQFKQGSLTFTGNSLDLAISGKGYFMLDQDGSRVYTRAGAFGVNRDGTVVNAAGQSLLVYPTTENDTSVFQTGLTEKLAVPSGQGAPEATTQVDMALNVSSDDDGFGTSSATAAALFDPSNADTYNRSTSVTVYDSFGSSHILSVFYQRIQDATGTNSNAWNSFVYLDAQLDGTDVDITSNAGAGGTPIPHVLNFDGTGKLTDITQPDGTTASAPATTADYTAYSLDPGGGAAAMNLTLGYDSTTTTQYSGAFAVSSLKQDGVPPGRLIGLNISDEGVVFARFSNGSSNALGKVAIADFDNPQGLAQLGDASWAEAFESGVPRAGEAGQGSFGAIKSGALEGSNVELTDELVRLITAQRNFQANARAIETNNQLTQSIIQIR